MRMTVARMTIAAVAIAFVLSAGCASHPDPIVDTKGVNMAQYEIDLRECRQYADEVSVAGGAAKGAAAGAVVGAAAGAISGDADRGAGYGAIGGGARSALYNQREKERVVKNCLRGRGYRILN